MPSSDLLLVDPSFLLSPEGVRWLEEDEYARHEVVISRALAESLRSGIDIGVFRFIAPEDERGLSQRMERLSEFIEGMETFSYSEVDLPPPEAAVRDALLSEAIPARVLLADEWAFLVSYSWMAAKRRYVLDKFRDAGAAIVEFPRKLRDEMISAVVPSEHVPAALTRGFLLKVGVKWLVAGGASAGGIFYPPAALAGLVVPPVLRAFDP